MVITNILICAFSESSTCIISFIIHSALRDFCYVCIYECVLETDRIGDAVSTSEILRTS